MGYCTHHLVEVYPTPERLAAAPSPGSAPSPGCRGPCRKSGGSSHGASRRGAARDGAGLTEGVEPILNTQTWLLVQLRHVDEHIGHAERAIEAALEAWPESERAILSSLPGMTRNRRAVLLSIIFDLASFRDDRQMRKFLGWYPELRESGTSYSSGASRLHGSGPRTSSGGGAVPCTPGGGRGAARGGLRYRALGRSGRTGPRPFEDGGPKSVGGSSG